MTSGAIAGTNKPTAFEDAPLAGLPTDRIAFSWYEQFYVFAIFQGVYMRHCGPERLLNYLCEVEPQQ